MKEAFNAAIDKPADARSADENQAVQTGKEYKMGRRLIAQLSDPDRLVERMPASSRLKIGERREVGEGVLAGIQERSRQADEPIPEAEESDAEADSISDDPADAPGNPPPEYQSPADDDYRTQAMGGNAMEEWAAFRKAMNLGPIPEAAKPKPKPAPVSFDDDDTESLQTDDDALGDRSIHMYSGVPAARGPRPGALNFTSYFSTFGARRKEAGFVGALMGRGGARAEAAKETRAAEARRAQARKWAQPSLFTRNFSKAPYPWMRGENWNRDQQRGVGREADGDREQREWTDDPHLATNDALKMSRGSTQIWEANLDEAHKVREQMRNGGGDSFAKLRAKVHQQVKAQGTQSDRLVQRRNELMRTMLNLSPSKSSADEPPAQPYAKDGRIDGITESLPQPSKDYDGYIPPAVREVFRDFEPEESDGGPGYAGADMLRLFPGIELGAYGHLAGARRTDSDRTLSNYDPNEYADEYPEEVKEAGPQQQPAPFGAGPGPITGYETAQGDEETASGHELRMALERINRR
jgi:hypothetical protein